MLTTDFCHDLPSYDRDYDYDFFGFKTLERSYLIKMHGNVRFRRSSRDAPIPGSRHAPLALLPHLPARHGARLHRL